MNLRSTLEKKNPKRVVSFLTTLCLLAVSIGGMTISLANPNNGGETQVSESYSLPNVVNPDTGQNMYVVKSSFYDYYSDSQITAAAQPGEVKDAITSGKNTFTKFNKRLLEDKKYGSTADSPAVWPLYEGLFFSKQESDANGGMYFYDDANASKNFDTNFWLAANHTQTSKVAAATQGLVDATLDNNGNITQSNSSNGKTCVLPYFDKTYLTTTKHTGSELTMGAVRENVGFPLVQTTQNGITYYSFDSSKDTVCFNASNQLDYQGQGNKQVKDSNGAAGFFPYNNTSESKSYSLNYGFGMKMEIPFSMTADGKVNGQDMIFEFAGDDDLWVFVDGQLVLDVGGIHGIVNGKINFATLSSTVSAVKNNSIAFSNPNCLIVEDKTYTVDNLKSLGLTDKTSEEQGIMKEVNTAFSEALKEKLRDTTKAHTMTVFYMERGKVGSNLKINFNMPEANKLEIANTIDYSGVNNAFTTQTGAVTVADTFLYDVVDKDANMMDEANIKGGESVVYQDKFKQGDTIMVEQIKLKDNNRKLKQLYETGWLLKDTTTDIASSNGREAEIVSDGRVQEKDAFLFKNKTDEAATPNMKVNFVNKVKTGVLVIRNQGGEGVNTNKSFKYTVEVANIFGGNSEVTKYQGNYTLVKSSGEKALKKCSGTISLKAGEQALIEGVPVFTKYSISQTSAQGYELEKVARIDGAAYSSANNKAEGAIVVGQSNENAYVFYNKVSGNGAPVEELKDTTVPTEIETTPLIDPVEDYDGVVKNEVTPKTGDESASKTNFWIMSVVISAILVLISGYVLFFKPVTEGGDNNNDRNNRNNRNNGGGGNYKNSSNNSQRSREERFKNRNSKTPIRY